MEDDKLDAAEEYADRAYYSAREGSKTETLAKAVRLLIAEVRELRKARE